MNALRYYSRLVIKITLGILSIPILIIVLIVGYSFANDAQMKVRGYYVMTTGVDLATILVNKHLPASECLLFRNPTFAIMTPSTGEHIQNCIHRYAEMTKDPSACELLMPSSYGLSCVGGAIESPECGFNSGYEVQWNEGDPVVKSSLKNCQKNVKRSEIGDACCFIAKIGFVKNENDCTPLKKQVSFYDECLDRLSFKNHDPATCEGITDKNLRIACTVRAKAMKKDPSICTGCTPLIEKLEDIQ